MRPVSVHRLPLRAGLLACAAMLLPSVALAQFGDVCQHPDLQTAINAAVATGNGTIYVQTPGAGIPLSFMESVTINAPGMTIRIVAATSGCAPLGGSTPMVHMVANPGARAIDILDGEVVLEGIHVTQGSAAGSAGGNIRSSSDAPLSLFHSHVSQGSADEGGGIAITGCGGLKMDEHSRIYENDARLGGGVALTGNCTKNLAVNGTIDRNTASDDGGGIWIEETTATLLGEARLANNVAVDHGGALYALNSQIGMFGTAWTPAPTGTVPTGGIQIAGNSADHGGGMSLAQSELTGRNVVMSRNHVTDSGGALALYSTYASLTNSVLQANHAPGVGGAVLLSSSAHLDFLGVPVVGGCDPSAPGFPANRYCAEMSHNSANEGGAIAVRAATGSATVDKAALLDNQALSGAGTAIQVLAGNVELVNTLVESNAAPPFGVAPRTTDVEFGGFLDVLHVTFGGNFTRVDFTNTGFGNIDHSAFDTAGGLTVATLGNVAGDYNIGFGVPALLPGGVGNVSALPGFGPNFRLTVFSPARNMCPWALPDDLVGTVRPAGLPLPSDAGAFEF